MRNRKLYPLTKMLSQGERDRFGQFLQHPMFNSSPTLELFWQLWRERVLETAEGEDLEVASFVAGSPIKASRLDRLCSQLFPKLRQFLAVIQLEEKEGMQDLLFTEALMDRKPELEGNQRILNDIGKSLQRLPESPEKYLGQLYFQLFQTQGLIASRKVEPGLYAQFMEMQAWVDGFAESKRLQLACALTNMAQIIRQNEEDAMEPDRLKAEYLSGPEPQASLPKIYSLVLALQLGHNTDQTFDHLLDLLKTDGERIAPDLRTDIYNFTLNHCIRQVNQGNVAFLDHAIRLHAHLLETGLILDQGKLSPQQFKNIVALGCRGNRLDWVEAVIEEYSPLLADDHDGIAHRYNLAILRFHQGMFQDAITLLKEVIQRPKLDVFYGLDARGYLWKAYYEHREQLSPEGIDDMYKLYDSLRLYVDRNTKISVRHKGQYRSFVRLFRRFLLLLQESDEQIQLKSLRAFQLELRAAGPFPNKTWFAQKIAAAIEDRA